MRKSLKLITLFVLISGLSKSFGQTNYVTCTGKLQVKENQIVGDKGVPVQLRGISLFWSQWQGKYYNYNTIKWLRDDWKVTVVRAAMGTGDDAGNSGYINSPEIEKAKIKTVVEASIDLGIYVIIDWHSHSAEKEKAESIAFFQEMAELYGSYPNVIYEIYNEPLNSTSWANTIKPYAEDVIAAIREKDPDNLIIVGTKTWSQDVDEASNNPIKDVNIAYTLHFYANSHGQYLRNKAQTALDNKVALFVTEYGTCSSSGGGDVNEDELALWYKFMDDNFISHCNWSIADKKETASAIPPGASTDGGWLVENLTVSGKIVRNEILTNYMDPICSDSPSIVRQPQDIVVNEDNSGEFRVFAYGADLKYQWFEGELKLEGEIDSVLKVGPVAKSDSGRTFNVMVYSDLDTIYSSNVVLKVRSKGAYFGSPMTIPGKIEVEYFDIGPKSEAFYDSDVINNGGALRNDQVDIESIYDGGSGYAMSWVSSGEWVVYTVKITKTADYDFIFRTTSAATNDGKIYISLDDVKIMDNIVIPKTGSWSKWTNTNVEKIHLDSGVYKMKLYFKASGTNINYIDVVENKSTGISSNIESIGLTVFPNPSSDMLHISSTNKHLTGQAIEVLDLRGIQILTTRLESSGVDLQVNDLKSGVYILKIPVDGRVYYHKWVKQ